jgi:hypothetical protein
MGTVSITVDLEALAQAAQEAYTQTAPVVVEDLQAGLGAGSPGVAMLHYPLLRLRGLQLITEDERVQVEQLLDAVSSGAEVARLSQALQERADASPLAVALARLVPATMASPVRQDWRGMAGVITGAYLGFTTTVLSAATDGGSDVNERARVAALVSILGAIGGATATAALAFIREVEGQ